ncbi:hypothetical protein CspHIS471_0304670 [Cutaneotrichosporon sp. HIS471]|nr:hypothetical protein CspHIS471_0304670 [Cutaneotrichosporon sp. HIS471]
MPPALELLYTIAPCVLALPVLALALPAAPAPAEIPGIRAVTIKTITPRRTFITLTLGAIALTYALGATLLVVDLILKHEHGAWFIGAAAGHVLGGFADYSLTAILAEWRGRWGSRWLVLLALLGFGFDVPILVLQVIREIHAGDDEHVLAILSLPLTALRLLLLPLLVVLVLNPVVRFQAADENTGLLAADEEEPARPSNGYGTFDSDQDASTTRDPSVAPGTPQPQQKKPITKKLGEKKVEETQGLSWSAFWARIWKLRGHLWPSTSWRLQLYCWLCVALLGVGTLVFAYTPIMLGHFVDVLSDIENGRRGESPWKWFVMWIMLRAVQGGGFVGFFQRMLWVPVQQYADREMQMLLFNHLLNLSLKFHTKRNTGEVLKIIDRGSAINNLLQTMLFSAAPTIINIVVAVFIFFALFGGWLAVVLIVVMTTYVVFSIVFTGYRTKLRREMIDRDIKTRGIASDVLVNWESVKYFTAEARESRRFHDSVLLYQQTEYRVLFSFNVLNLIQSFIITIGLLAGSLIIANRIYYGTATVGNFVQFLQYLQQLYAPLDRLGTLYRQLNANATDAEKLFNLLGQEVEITDAPDSQPLVVTDGVIEFNDVCFSYDGEVQALKDVSFRIGKGESMALVGESGSGKSTILRLLYRFYDIDSGTIKIDGQDISKVTQKSLRQAIGIVPQDSVLWNDTIGANISYGKEDGAEDEEIVAAAHAAKLHDRIMTFPEEYDTVVGERGVRLSGGEKQRVSLARMFLKSPAILVLDEATSALDTETEREIQRSLAELAANRSSLSIAHRLSTIINSDQIVVMKNGAVIEQGTYHDLIERGGQFAAMWRKQIFTEEEMMAETEALGPGGLVSVATADGAVVLAAGTVDDDGTLHIRRASPPSTVHESEGSVSEADKEDDLATTPRSPGIQGPMTYAQIVVAPPDTDLPASLQQDSEPASPALPALQPAYPNLESASPEPESKSTMASQPKPKPSQRPQQSPPKLERERERSPTPRASFPGAAFPGTSTAFPGASATPPMTRSSSSNSASAQRQEDVPSAGSSDRGEKRRKRLSSIKGFVRRMSDHGRPGKLNRSDSAAGSNRSGDSEGERSKRNSLDVPSKRT